VRGLEGVNPLKALFGAGFSYDKRFYAELAMKVFDGDASSGTPNCSIPGLFLFWEAGLTATLFLKFESLVSTGLAGAGGFAALLRAPSIFELFSPSDAYYFLNNPHGLLLAA
jgi:hypothetical protein